MTRSGDLVRQGLTTALDTAVGVHQPSSTPICAGLGSVVPTPLRLRS